MLGKALPQIVVYEEHARADDVISQGDVLNHFMEGSGEIGGILTLSREILTRKATHGIILWESKNAFGVLATCRDGELPD